MKQILTNNDDFDLSGEIEVFSDVLPAGPDGYALKGEVRLGDGAKDIAGDGVYSLRATLGGVTVFSSDVVVPAGMTRRILDFECLGRAGETLAVLVTGLAGDAGADQVDVTTFLYTGVNVVEISEDEVAADALETVLDGTGGAVLKAAQLKLSCNVDSQGALDCENLHETGRGQRNYGGAVGLYNEGESSGQYNEGGDQGQINHGDVDGQQNSGGGVGQHNLSALVGQRNRGTEAQVNEGTGVTPKALTLIGAADLLDELAAENLPADIDVILADTNALIARLTAARALLLNNLVNIGVGAIPTLNQILAGDVDSTGTPITLAKALEVLTAFAMGRARWDPSTKRWVVYGRDGTTVVAQGRVGDEPGTRIESEIP